jgi:hypothetical protein
MSLPDDPKAPWPPRDIAGYAQDQAAWHAWWSGDPTRLADTSPGGSNGRRTFWARRKTGTDTTNATSQLHAPLAADIAATSADLLFGDEIKLRVNPGDDAGKQAAVATQARLEELTDLIGLTNRLLEAAETCAAVGGVYLRPVWDTTVADHPLLTAVDADQAVPDFRLGILVAVTFTQTVHEDGDTVWRHLERHEPGRILHGLYAGSKTLLGASIPLESHPATTGLTPEVTTHAENPILANRLVVQYVPNVLPNRKRRRYPIGRSDFAGSEPFLDALDEAWTSWIRDLRLGVARVFVPDEFLTPSARPAGQAGFGGFFNRGGPGAGKGFDVDTELLSGLNIDQIEKMTSPLTPVQFKIRVEEHQGTCQALTEQIVSSAGWSRQTFGIGIDGQAESGTALKVREGKTGRTLGRKQRYWDPAVAATAQTLLALDATIFGRRDVVPARPSVVWPEETVDPVQTGQWLQLMAQAEAMSIETRVRMAQPDLDDTAVGKEVARIKAERGTSVGDPFAPGTVPPGDPGDNSDVG